MEAHINIDTLKQIKIDHINNLHLRSDLENNNIFDCKLIPQGYVENRSEGFEGDTHEDGTWAIDCFTLDGGYVCSYLYVSELDYEQDLKLLNLTKIEGKEQVQQLSNFVAIHQHEFGTSVFHLESDKELETYVDNENDADNDHVMQVIDVCGIDFEPEKGETLQIIEVPKTYTI